MGLRGQSRENCYVWAKGRLSRKEGESKEIWFHAAGDSSKEKVRGERWVVSMKLRNE